MENKKALVLLIGKFGVNLHSYWDSPLGGGIDLDAAGAEFVSGREANVLGVSPELRQRFIDKLIAMTREEASSGYAGEAADALNLGSPDAWPVTWSNEAPCLACCLPVLANHGPNAKQKKNQFDIAWDSKQAYDGRCAPIGGQQMTAATRNLATLLNALLQ